MKKPWKWNEDDILKIIKNNEKESLTLDYKRCASLQKNEKRKNELSKDVSAFANSAGGTLIYGVKEDNHLPKEIDDGFDPEKITREWIEQIINSRINRKIDNIRINQIELKKSNPGKVIYVVYVPQSNRAPHMAYDNKYYKKYNFQSEPMEDYEVRDVSRRDDAPDLDVKLEIDKKEIIFKENGLSDFLKLSMMITNHSENMAKYAILDLKFDKRIKIRVIQTDRTKEYSTNNNELKEYFHTITTQTHMPVWKDMELHIDRFTLQFPENNCKYLFVCNIDSPNMEPKRNKYNFIINNGKIKLEKIN